MNLLILAFLPQKNIQVTSSSSVRMFSRNAVVRKPN